MLISCPECNSQISDKAIACPHCGYPINQQPIVAYSPQPRKSRSHMKLPNGFGSIKKLSGNRRKPYAVYPPLRQRDYDDNGRPPKLQTLGYFETWYEAYDCLSKYNDAYVDGKTFSEVYEEWFAKKFYNELRPVSESTKQTYIAAYNACEVLHNKPISVITTSEMQDVINEKFKTAPSMALPLRKLFNQVFKFAFQEKYVNTNYAEFIVQPSYSPEKGKPFDTEELQSLWEHKDVYEVRIALILVYSGLRRGELKKTHIDLDRMVFEGGIKTTAGKERIVPIHPLIQDFVKDFNQSEYNFRSYSVVGFDKVKKACCLKPENKHTTHDCRHTFSWLCDKYKVDDFSKHLLMGHSVGTDVEKNTYGHRTLEELRTEIEKIKIT